MFDFCTEFCKREQRSQGPDVAEVPEEISSPKSWRSYPGLDQNKWYAFEVLSSHLYYHV